MHVDEQKSPIEQFQSANIYFAYSNTIFELDKLIIALKKKKNIAMTYNIFLGSEISGTNPSEISVHNALKSLRQAYFLWSPHHY